MTAETEYPDSDRECVICRGVSKIVREQVPDVIETVLRRILGYPTLKDGDAN